MAQKKSRLTSGSFASLCGTTKETLRHYKEIGLLSPAYQGENGYYYYDVEQFYDFYAISIFRQTGTSLEEIRSCLLGQDVPKTLTQLREQKRRLAEERQKLEQMEFILSATIGNLELGTAQDMTPKTAWFPKEHLMALSVEALEPLMPQAVGEDELLIAVLERCQQLCRQYGITTNYQLGAIHVPSKQVSQATISHLYIPIKEKVDFPYYLEKPAGTYLYLCCQGRWDLSEGYTKLLQYIQTQKIKTDGSVYACDLAGFILNGVEKNAVSMISVRLS